MVARYRFDLILRHASGQNSSQVILAHDDQAILPAAKLKLRKVMTSNRRYHGRRSDLMLVQESIPLDFVLQSFVLICTVRKDLDIPFTIFCFKEPYGLSIVVNCGVGFSVSCIQPIMRLQSLCYMRDRNRLRVYRREPRTDCIGSLNAALIRCLAALVSPNTPEIPASTCSK